MVTNGSITLNRILHLSGRKPDDKMLPPIFSFTNHLLFGANLVLLPHTKHETNKTRTLCKRFPESCRFLLCMEINGLWWFQRGVWRGQCHPRSISHNLQQHFWARSARVTYLARLAHGQSANKMRHSWALLPGLNSTGTLCSPHKTRIT